MIKVCEEDNCINEFEVKQKSNNARKRCEDCSKERTRRKNREYYAAKIAKPKPKPSKEILIKETIEAARRLTALPFIPNNKHFPWELRFIG